MALCDQTIEAALAELRDACEQFGVHENATTRAYEAYQEHARARDKAHERLNKATADWLRLGQFAPDADRGEVHVDA